MDLLECGAVLFRELHLLDVHDSCSAEADDDHGDAEVDDVLEREDLLHEHADEGADRSCEAHRERIVVDALTAALCRDHRRDNRARRRRSDAVADTVEAADEVEHGHRVDAEVHERRREIEEDTGEQHLPAAVELDRAAREEARDERAEDEDAGSEASLTHRGIQRVDGLRCDDDHQHIVDDVNQEIDKRIKDEPFRP